MSWWWCYYFCRSTDTQCMCKEQLCLWCTNMQCREKRTPKNKVVLIIANHIWKQQTNKKRMTTHSGPHKGYIFQCFRQNTKLHLRYTDQNVDKYNRYVELGVQSFFCVFMQCANKHVVAAILSLFNVFKIIAIHTKTTQEYNHYKTLQE